MTQSAPFAQIKFLMAIALRLPPTPPPCIHTVSIHFGIYWIFLGILEILRQVALGPLRSRPPNIEVSAPKPAYDIINGKNQNSR